MKQWVIQFVSGMAWEARAPEAPPIETNGWWRVQRIEPTVLGNREVEMKVRGFWLVNLSNVEALKES